MRGLVFTVLITSLPIMISCTSARDHAQSLHSEADREFTLGVVQKEIRIAMAADEVASALGSPNIVTRDKDGRDTWIYDKIATEASYSSSRTDLNAAGFGATAPGSSLLLGILGAGHQAQSGAQATTQKTLTVIIKFDRNQRVCDYSYHSSKF